jgi:tetratricopeptide (TPR) repeat protein
MDGRVLTSIYEEPPAVAFIDSWDAVTGEDGRHPPDTRISTADSAEAIRQLVDLGYIDEPNADRAVAVEETTRELRDNLARAYVDGGKFADAIGIFSELWERWPDESRFGVRLLQTQMDAGHVLDARETMTRLRERKAAAMEAGTEELNTLLAEILAAQTKADSSAPTEIDWEQVKEDENRKVMRLRRRAGANPKAFAFLEGSLLHLEGRHNEALAALGRAAEVQTSNRPGLYLKMGEVGVSKRDWAVAAEHFAKATELDPLNAQAHFGLARVAAHRGDWAVAAEEAMASAGQHYYHAPAHYLAGCAFWKLRQTEQALACLERAIAINPVYPAAHRTLASFHRQERADWPAHLRHRRLAREATQRIVEQRAAGLPRDLHPMEVRETFGTVEDSPDTTPPILPPLAETIVVVTGLPRSGTSMLMQMLQAGGVPALADDHRPADASNERGYLEFEGAKKLATDASWVAGAKGQAVKLVAQLVPGLPREHVYRFIMIHRSMAEVIASQKKMLQRLGKPGAAISDEALQRAFHQQVTQVRTLLMHLRKQGTLDVLDLKYHDVLRDPRAATAQLATFLGAPFDIEAAAAAVAPNLRHEMG